MNPVTDAELAQLDITALLRRGLTDPRDRGQLFGEGAVGAAVLLHRLGTIPRSLTFLAEVARAGGARYAAELAEPLPEPAQTDLIRPWLAGVATIEPDLEIDRGLADWLDAVATIITVRATNRWPVR